jgi:phthalate 4,5-dioxygenase oxygenase subunit
MLSPADNELLTQIGPGTPMGNLLRQYWIPGMPALELQEADGPPKRMRLLGENLVAFRDSTGQIGVVAENCPHRGASLFFGRNEEAGLRCVYHGWKFDATGSCVDMPNEPPESNFKQKVKVLAYPARDVNGMIWVYMGPRQTPPPLPALEFNTVPSNEVFAPSMMHEENNWVQGVEGDIDSSHIDYLHARLRDDVDVDVRNGAPRGFRSLDRAPKLEVVGTRYGAVYAAKRRWDEQGNYWYRISQFMMPFYTMIAASNPNMQSARAWVPLDNQNTMLTGMQYSVKGPLPDSPLHEFGLSFKSVGYKPQTGDALSRYRLKANKSNDYLRDYEKEKTQMFSGIPFAGNLQDVAMTESMGHVYDRTHERLGTSDLMVIFVRRMLLKACRDLQEHGIVPESVDNPTLYRVRSASIILPEDKHWFAATEGARDADSGEPVSYVVQQ